MRISGVTYAVRKTHRARNITITVIVLLLAAVLTAVILSVYESFTLLHPQKKPVDIFSSNIMPEYRDISFKSADSSGKTTILKGWLFQSKYSDKAVILVHSYGRNRLQFGSKTVDMIKGFLNRGYGVFAFDLRNSGESGGRNTSFGLNEKNDVLAAINYVYSQGSRHITLLGFSTGASASILAAAESDAVDAVIADSPYSDLKTYFSNNLNKWTHLPSLIFNNIISFSMETVGDMDLKSASPIGALTSGRPPYLMLIHDRGDELIPVENSIELYQKYSAMNPGCAEFWQTDDGGNATNYEKHPGEYMSRVMAFLDKVYAGQ